MLLLWLSAFTPIACGAFISNFDNCLPPSIQNAATPLLQWVPRYVGISVDSTRSLDITVYGNVKGQMTAGEYPSPDSPRWSDPQDRFGKIFNVSQSNTVTTLFQRYDVLTYRVHDGPREIFCNTTVNGTECPIAPRFSANDSDPYSFAAFAVRQRLNASYAFASLVATLRVKSGDSEVDLACISAVITPDLRGLSDILMYTPVAVVVLVAIATILASTYCPWGTTNVFRWTSNFGRDPDLLRLVTPGFGDCLQYVQFIILAGSLSLAYPGYYQPVVSHVGWSALMFNTSLVNGGGTRNPVDGVYATNGTYGLSRMSQLVGMSGDTDLWAGTVVWTLVIIAIVLFLCETGFAVQWLHQRMSDNPAEDLQSKNWPFTGGNLVRVVCNFFLLPIVSLTMFQLVVASRSPGFLVGLAVVLLVALLVFAGWILRLIITTKPRAKLFDDLSTVMLYGPLYNTYSDDAAPFALIPAMLTFMRGVAIGAVQPSGIAQLVILAVCEVILILTLHAFRPFNSPTSMNAYHTFFASVRLATVLLMVAFAPSLGVTEGPKGWIGYVILALHAIVLVFGFFLNAVQRIVEVVARLAGAGGESSGATRGGLVKIFGGRQLSRRPRRASPHSMHSDAAILGDGDTKSEHGRARSVSASSTIMLARSEARLSRHLSSDLHFDDYSYMPPTRTEHAGPYYRPPRPRRQTGDVDPGVKSREEELALPTFAADSYQRAREASDTNIHKQGRPSVDYAVREVDMYYGLRGPALSSQPTRKLKTGPADPVGPVSSATGWFRGILGGKKKDSGKGFEVVRSARAPQEDSRQSFDGQDDLSLEIGPPSLDPIETPSLDFPSRWTSKRYQRAPTDDRPEDMQMQDYPARRSVIAD